MWPVLFLAFLQAAASPAAVAELTVEADGRQWGAFARIVPPAEDAATVTLEDGWIDPAFLELWWPAARKSAPGLEPGVHAFDDGDCRGRRVEVRQALGPGRMSRVRSWTLLGACPVAWEVAGEPEDGRLPLGSLTFRVEGVGSAM